MANTIVEKASWVRRSDRIVELRFNHVLFSFVVKQNKKFHVYNAAMTGGEFDSLDAAKDAAETYWREQDANI